MTSLVTMSIGHYISGIIGDVISDAISDDISHVTFSHDVVGDFPDISDVIRHTSHVIRHTSFVTQSLTLKLMASVTFH